MRGALRVLSAGPAATEGPQRSKAKIRINGNGNGNGPDEAIRDSLLPKADVGKS